MSPFYEMEAGEEFESSLCIRCLWLMRPACYQLHYPAICKPHLSVRYADEVVLALSAALALTNFTQAFHDDAMFITVCKPAYFAYRNPVVFAENLLQPSPELLNKLHSI